MSNYSNLFERNLININFCKCILIIQIVVIGSPLFSQVGIWEGFDPKGFNYGGGVCFDKYDKEIQCDSVYDTHGKYVSDTAMDSVKDEYVVYSAEFKYFSERDMHDNVDSTNVFIRRYCESLERTVSFFRDNDVDFINMSWGITEYDATRYLPNTGLMFISSVNHCLNEIVSENKDIIFVASAPNDHINIDTVYIYPRVSGDNFILVSNEESAFGEDINIVINGDFNNGIIKQSGTSISAPRYLNSLLK